MKDSLKFQCVIYSVWFLASANEYVDSLTLFKFYLTLAETPTIQPLSPLLIYSSWGAASCLLIVLRLPPDTSGVPSTTSVTCPWMSVTNPPLAGQPAGARTTAPCREGAQVVP